MRFIRPQFFLSFSLLSVPRKIIWTIIFQISNKKRIFSKDSRKTKNLLFLSSAPTILILSLSRDEFQKGRNKKKKKETRPIIFLLANLALRFSRNGKERREESEGGGEETEQDEDSVIHFPEK